MVFASYFTEQAEELSCSDMSLHPEGLNIPMKEGFIDNGGRRSGVDRRVFSYAVHIPERRVTADRRLGMDRRKHPREHE